MDYRGWLRLSKSWLARVGCCTLCTLFMEGILRILIDEVQSWQAYGLIGLELRTAATQGSPQEVNPVLSALFPVLLTSHYPSAVTEPTRPTRVRSKSTWISRCFAALEYRPGQQKHSSYRHPCQPRSADAHRKHAARPQGLPIPPDLEGGTPPAGGEEETLETDRRDRHEADLARLLPR